MKIAWANGMDALVRDTGVSTVAEAGAIGHALVCESTYNNARKTGFIVPDSKDLWETGDFTLSCWLRRLTTNNYKK